MTIDDINDIKELIRVVNEMGIAELELQIGDKKVRITRTSSLSTPEVRVPVMPVAVGPAVTAAPMAALPATQPEQPISGPPAGKANKESENNDVLIKSPIVGTYYDAPSPGSPPFVKVGDRVEPKQVLCIIESMKLMNEIEAEVAGVVTAKLVENGRPVEYGESLFTIRPHGV
jgi:acetyl-CoA carboxylase biotin carboxyl carrier protein